MDKSTPFISPDYFQTALLKKKKFTIPPIPKHNLEEGAGASQYPRFRELFKDLMPEVHIHKQGHELAGAEKIFYEEEGDYKIARIFIADDEIATVKKLNTSDRRIFMYDGPGGFVIWFLSHDHKARYIFPSDSYGHFEDIEITIHNYKRNYAYDPSNTTLIHSLLKPITPLTKQSYINKAVIMATGHGHLTSPISGNLTGVSKYTIPINKKHLINYTVDSLKAHNITNISINTHTLPKSVEYAVQEGHHTDANIHFCYEYSLKGTAISILKNIDFLGTEEHFIVMQGDVIAHFDISQMVINHIHQDAGVTIGLYPEMQNPRFGYADMESSGHNSGKILKLTTDNQILTPKMVPVLGLAIFSPKVWKYIKKSVKKLEKEILAKVDLEFNIIYDMVRSNEHVRGEIINGYWHTIDSIRKYCDLSQIIDNHINIQSGKLIDRQPIIWEWAEEHLDPNSTISGNVIVIK